MGQPGRSTSAPPCQHVIGRWDVRQNPTEFLLPASILSDSFLLLYGLERLQSETNPFKNRGDDAVDHDEIDQAEINPEKNQPWVYFWDQCGEGYNRQ